MTAIGYDNNFDFGSEFSPLGGVVYRLPWKDGLIHAQIAKGGRPCPAHG